MPKAPPAFRILVVEDEAFSRKMLGRLLKELGAEHVVLVSSCAEARAAMAADPALRMVVADHYMADGTGIALLAETRQGKLPLAHDTFFIVATASTSFALTAAALALDVDSFMSKPFGKDELAQRLYNFLNGHRTIKPVEHYQGIDAAAMLHAAEMMDPMAATLRPAGASAPPLTPLNHVLPETALAADLIAADGHMLLKAGTVLTRHLIGRLTELGVTGVPTLPGAHDMEAEKRRALLDARKPRRPG